MCDVSTIRGSFPLCEDQFIISSELSVSLFVRRCCSAPRLKPAVLAPPSFTSWHLSTSHFSKLLVIGWLHPQPPELWEEAAFTSSALRVHAVPERDAFLHAALHLHHTAPDLTAQTSCKASASRPRAEDGGSSRWLSRRSRAVCLGRQPWSC